MQSPLDLLGLGFLAGRWRSLPPRKRQQQQHQQEQEQEQKQKQAQPPVTRAKPSIIMTVTLPADAVWSTAGRPGVMVRCANGVVWLTQTGAGQDIVLGTGSTFTAERDGKLVMTALKPAVIQVGYQKTRL